MTAADRAAVDITDADATARAVAGHELVINAAAWTDVEAAERAEAAATEVNGAAVARLAGACAASGIPLLHVSSDYVFAGSTRVPYPEDAPPGPVNAYGRSKLAGERAIRRLLPERGYIVRTAWLYGEHGPNFVATMLNCAARSPSVDVVVDHVGQPTWSTALARQLALLGRAAQLRVAPPGVYHGTSSGCTSRYELTRTLFHLAGLDPRRVRPVTGAHFPGPVRRPAYAVLAHDRWSAAGVAVQEPWHLQLRQALETPGLATLARRAREYPVQPAPLGTAGR